MGCLFECVAPPPLLRLAGRQLYFHKLFRAHVLRGGVDGGVDAGDGGDALDGLSGGSVADSHGVLSREARGPWYGRVQRVGDGFSEMNLTAGVALGIGQAPGWGA